VYAVKDVFTRSHLSLMQPMLSLLMKVNTMLSRG